MTKIYQVTTSVRLINRLMRLLIRTGFAPKGYYLLTVPGRKSGRLYSLPVSLIEEGQNRWLVSPYGEVNWVRNARAAGQVTLSRGRQTETVKIVEVEPKDSAPVLKKYIVKESITRPYFDAGVNSPLEAFIAEAPLHPVFRLK